MTGGSSGLSSKSLDTSAGSTSWDCLRLVESLNIEPRRPGFLCFGVSGMVGLEEEELGVGLPEGSTNDFERSRLALERNLESFGPGAELVGDDGAGDARDGLPDIVVDGRGSEPRAPPTPVDAFGHSAPIPRFFVILALFPPVSREMRRALSPDLSKNAQRPLSPPPSVQTARKPLQPTQVIHRTQRMSETHMF